ncbi:coniferyl aldehyde dehydrogenase [Aquisalimonas asiatica]|uniref:Aldehyde dehydrogenase n=1 Tax=Aquisalimonas asiatica TaxID=406100 RepID=A0A1H8S019_9GAMM|nr:coniferyl aldehyde dehydrogenase [Aquisalimonas asiatica]SEO71876.1 coniferyl-aldehyde dehydrogenase [Aquisalimonas asiatica]
MTAATHPTADQQVTQAPPGASAMAACLERQRAAFQAAPYPDAATRRDALQRLRRAVKAHEQALTEAVSADFGGRSPHETATADIVPTLTGLRHAIRHVRRWMRPQRRWPHPLMQPARARVVHQPLGVVGIMVPWNYPVFLALAPLTGALAAGNRAMLKLSEFTPATNAVLRELLAAVFSADEVAVFEGDVPESQAFAALPFDHLLFTGSTAVGRQIMAAAAPNLTPVTLELGGKSPVIVDDDADIAAVASRLVFGKLVNAGQTCIAPDYVLCTPARRDALLAAIRATVARRYPRLGDNPDYTSIVNAGQHERLLALLDDARQKGARIEAINPAGEGHPDGRRLAPHLVLDAPDGARVLEEELFGPILPIVTVPDLDAALAYVARRPRPLALYYFGRDRGRQQRVLRESHSGGVCLNDTLLHVAQDNLPFGGVGASGMGRYHGHYGFANFSHEKAVFAKGRINTAAVMYPPYGGVLQRLVHRLLAR